MGRFLVIGTGPLLDEADTKLVSGQCLRTMHFVEPMRAAGHQVALSTVPIPGCEDAVAGQSISQLKKYQDRFKYKSFTTADENRIVTMIRRIVSQKTYDGVVGINAYPAYLLARAEPRVPFWADLNGWTMAEGQTRAARVRHDRDLDHFWRLEVSTLLRGDRFSTVSERQADALYGELSLIGRLTGATFDWPFATPVANAIYPLYDQLKRAPKSLLTSPTLPDDAHVVLWSGGFNTWTDIELLANGLKLAMEHEPRLHFVATGGAVTGHDDNTFTKFKKLAAERLPAERTHLLGWVETDAVVTLHARANVGINIDSRNTETRFGARNRLTNMLGAGVPVLTTEGTEIAAWISANKAGEVVPLGNAKALAEALVESAANAESWEKRARLARRKARKAFAPEQTLGEFLSWCERPNHAPDKKGADIEARLWARLKADGQVNGLLTDRASLRNLREKLPLRLWYKLKSLAGEK